MLKDLSKIYGFMHICTINNWRSVVDEQLHKIVQSGLYDKLTTLYCGVVGKQDTSFLSKYSKIQILYKDPNIRNFEFLTLEHLQNFCKIKAPPNSKLFYIHTKGISKKGKPDPISNLLSGFLVDWRRYLEYYIIEQHDECIKQLNDADIVGVSWRGFGTENPVYNRFGNHFSGNFWWAQSDYITQLGRIDEGSHGRCEAEFWIGKGVGTVISLFQANIDHYKERWHEDNYKNKIEIRKWRFKKSISQVIEVKNA